MDVYMFQADLWCDDCARQYMRENEPPAGADLEDEGSYESDDWPNGPYADSGGESDCPQHCGACSVFLGNPITDEGRSYVGNAIAQYAVNGSGDVAVLREWAEFYGITVTELLD